MPEKIAETQRLKIDTVRRDSAPLYGTETVESDRAADRGRLPRILAQLARDICLLSPAQIFVLQRTVGNQAVSRLTCNFGEPSRTVQSTSSPTIKAGRRALSDLSTEARNDVHKRQPNRLTDEACQPNLTLRADKGLIQSQAGTSPPVAGDAGSSPARAVWQVPDLFGGATANNGADASVQLIDIKSQLEPLKDQFDGIPIVFDAIQKLLPETYGADNAGPLKPELAAKLTGAGLAAAGAYNVALRQLKSTLQKSLSTKLEDADEIAEKAAEILHEAAFGKEADNEALEHAKEGFENVHDFVEWSHYANEWVVTALKMAQSAEKFEMVVHALEGIGEFGEKASVAIAAVTSAFDFYTAIKVSKDPGKSDAQKMVTQLKAGFSLVPGIAAGAATVATLTSAATGVGLLWTTLAPQVEQALHMITQLDDMIAAYYKASSAEEWWEEARKGAEGRAPQIPRDQLSHFPGGQETLDFMWDVFKVHPPEKAPALVEKFFYEERKKFNVGHEDQSGDKLETEWHLFKPNEVTNLIPWVQQHKDEVWGMLYGSLPHP